MGNKKELVLAGGGHAHMMVLANLQSFIDKGFQVTVIQPSEHHYYSGMGPGMLGRTYSPDDIRFATRHVVEKQGGRFILDKVIKADPKQQLIFLENGEPIHYDTVSFNVGSYVPKEIITNQTDNIFTVKPIESLLKAQQKILALAAERIVKIAIIGGGASAVEIAGNALTLTQKNGLYSAEVKIFARGELMSRFSHQIREKAVHSLSQRGIEIFENCTVSEIVGDTIKLAGQNDYDADVIFVAVGVRPSPVFEKSGLATGPDGGLLVNRFLQSDEYPNIFGGGDCIYFKDSPLDKVGVYAVRENPVLLHNLMASLEGKVLMEFNPGGDYLLIFNLGDGTGIFKKKFVNFNGRPAFWLKDYIDRKFMKKFQAIE